jgi:lactoylglutathione lyase
VARFESASISSREAAPTIPVEGLFEVHLPVSDLGRAVAFYRDTLGFRLAHIESARQVAFFWIGDAGSAMLGLWSAGPAPQRITSHTAFRVSLPDVLTAPRRLRAAGVTPLDFDGRPTDQPIVFAWMPAASVFFHDPDGHLLEYLAMLSQEPRPHYGIVPWRLWEHMHRASAFTAAPRSKPPTPF